MLFTNKISNWIAKNSLVPATLFSKEQVSTISEEFRAFWGLSESTLSFEKPKSFNTFTLTKPKTFWTYFFPSESAIEALRNAYELIPFKIKCKQGEKISGMRFKSTNKNAKQKKFLIVFNGNGSIYRCGSQAWLFKLLTQNDDIAYDVIMFDPRGSGESKGKTTPQSLIEDGDLVYQFVKTTLGADEHTIDLYGFSLGGALATILKAKHPSSGGVLINNRSFHSLGTAAKGFLTQRRFPFSKALSKIALSLTKQSGWDFSPIDVWNKISSSDTLVISHNEDPIIYEEATLGKALEKGELLKNCLHIKLKQKNPEDAIKNHHVQPLASYTDQNGCDVEEQISSFLFRKHNYTSLE